MGLQTRQAQSITWATKRKLFDNISDKKKAEIDAVAPPMKNWLVLYPGPPCSPSSELIVLRDTQERTAFQPGEAK
jgi:hypothetical protein